MRVAWASDFLFVKKSDVRWVPFVEAEEKRFRRCQPLKQRHRLPKPGSEVWSYGIVADESFVKLGT